MKQNLNKKGFTLIELLVVIAIIGILAAITVVSVQGPRTKATDTRTISELQQYASLMEQYYGDTGNYPQNRTALTGATSIASDLTAAGLPTTPLNSANGTIAYGGATDTNGTTYCLYALNANTTGVATGKTAYITCTNGANCKSRVEFTTATPPSQTTIAVCNAGN